jgi:hypothetical protein
MKVENPIRRIAQEDRLEELPDDTPIDEGDKIVEKKT